MDRVRGSRECVDDDGSLMDALGYTGDLFQEEVGDSDDFISFSSNESDDQSTVFDCNDLFGMERRIERATEITGACAQKEKGGLVDICCESRPNKPISEQEQEYVMEGVVCSYGKNDEFCSALKNLIMTVFGKFTDHNICEDKYKQKSLFSSGLESIVDGDEVPCLKEIEDIVLRVAVTSIMEADEGRDFLLKASSRVKKYLVSHLGLGGVGFDGKSLTCILLESELGFFVCSEESLKKGIASTAVSLLKDVSAKCRYFRSNRYCYDVQARSSLSPWAIGIFLRKIIVLLALFPEALRPVIINNNLLSEENFYEFFPPEGHGDPEAHVIDICDSDEDVFDDYLSFWEEAGSSCDESDDDDLELEEIFPTQGHGFWE
ncbi:MULTISPECIES: hypothetical protein [Candidatus Ichthyocystis]|uniref:Uncharacterized protein n=1 Tax=Candidatus Ichthyocystis hellenicum TaxID=1561003 RepID=A0A0S4M0K6_9BURK|nr:MULTISPECIES: hypothetical protein [Ichthyocystis]CUT17262.1 hypothetical protein Ark11_0413 [Candidatus Ichthyocystis hellenicum]